MDKGAITVTQFQFLFLLRNFSTGFCLHSTGTPEIFSKHQKILCIKNSGCLTRCNKCEDWISFVKITSVLPELYQSFCQNYISLCQNLSVQVVWTSLWMVLKNCLISFYHQIDLVKKNLRFPKFTLNMNWLNIFRHQSFKMQREFWNKS